MYKSIILNIETQTEDGGLISLCHLSEKNIALEQSDIARKIFINNTALFNKISETTQIVGGSLYRQETISSSTNRNKLYSQFDNKTSPIETNISQMFFDNNTLRRQVRAVTKKGRSFDYDPDLVSDENLGGFFDEKNLSMDDIRDSIIISSVEEIRLFQENGIKSFLIIDNMSNKKSVYEVGYRIEFEVKTNFREYVEYVFKKCRKSLLFLEKYLHECSMNYDENRYTFKKMFIEDVFSSLNMVPDRKTANLGTETVKNSDLGEVAISYYNLLSLMRDTPKGIYSEVLGTLIPSQKTSPEKITNFISNFRRNLESITNYYLDKSTSNNLTKNKMWNKSHGINLVSTTSRETFSMDQEILGYSIFSEDVSGLNMFSSEDYKKRWALEQARYYPNLSINDSPYLSGEEKSDFSNTSNAPSFLTPMQLIMGKEKISTARGLKNMPIDKVRQFRMAKSARAEALSSDNHPHSKSRSKINSNVLSSFNLEIRKPTESLLSRSTSQDISPYEDAKKYVGEQSYFISNNPVQFIQNFNRVLTKDNERIFAIISDVVPRSFLRNEIAIKSIRDIDISNPKSKTRRMLGSREINLRTLPPHIKFMASGHFNPNKDSDPLKNFESRELIEETQKNIFQIRALTGFATDRRGLVNFNKPIYEDMSSEVLSSNKPILAKAYNYEVSELGIVKDKFSGTIYNNLIYIRG